MCTFAVAQPATVFAFAAAAADTAFAATLLVVVVTVAAVVAVDAVPGHLEHQLVRDEEARVRQAVYSAKVRTDLRSVRRRVAAAAAAAADYCCVVAAVVAAVVVR